MIIVRKMGSDSRGVISLAFYPQVGRTVSIVLLEKDGDGTNDIARGYTGYFDVDANGLYVMQRVTPNSAQSSVIEDEATVELCIYYRVSTHSSDTSTSLPANITKYCVWIC